MKIENIKFKAKRVAFMKGEWVEGELIHDDVKHPEKVHIAHRMKNVNIGFAEVDPSTVYQFTGLKDCNGNEVWEGDVLSNVTDDSPDGTVVFKYGAFSLLAMNGRDFCVALTYLLSEKDSLKRFKVVGNKFDKEK